MPDPASGGNGARGWGSFNCDMMAEESALIASRCEEAKASCELLLNNCSLRKFPDAIFFLMREVELKKVALSHNQLHKLPPKLGLKFVSIIGKWVTVAEPRHILAEAWCVCTPYRCQVPF